jgi:hypothetical protein
MGVFSNHQERQISPANRAFCTTKEHSFVTKKPFLMKNKTFSMTE